MTEATGDDVLVQVLQAVTGLRSSFESFAKRADEGFEKVEIRIRSLEDQAKVTNHRLSILETQGKLTNSRLMGLEEQATLIAPRLLDLEPFTKRTDQRFATSSEHDRHTDQRFDQINQSLTELWKLARRMEQELVRLGVSV